MCVCNFRTFLKSLHENKWYRYHKNNAADPESIGIGQQECLSGYGSADRLQGDLLCFGKRMSFRCQRMDHRMKPLIELRRIRRDVLRQMRAMKSKPRGNERCDDCNAKGAAKLTHHIIESRCLPKLFRRNIL